MDGLGELLVVHWLGDVDVAAEFIAADHLAGIISGGEDDHRDAFGALVGLQTLQDLIAVEHRQVKVKQHQEVSRVFLAFICPFAEQIVEGLLPVRGKEDLVFDVGAAQVLLDQPGMTGIGTGVPKRPLTGLFSR